MNKTIKFFLLIGVVFGIATIISGSSVLLGSDPGYVVFLPLVIFNTVMGFVYIVPGVVAWRNLELSKTIAKIILLLNLGALMTITYLYFAESVIAQQSLGAMSFRTIVWLIIYFALARAVSKQVEE